MRYLGQPRVLGGILGYGPRGGSNEFSDFMNTLNGLNAVGIWCADNPDVFSDAGSTRIADGGDVQQINDSSVNSNHMTQTTAGAKADWSESVAALNNRASLNYDGGDYYSAAVAGLVGNDATYLITGVIIADVTAQMAVYAEGNTATGTPFVFVGARSSAGQAQLFHRDDLSVLASRFGGADTHDGNPHIITMTRNTTSWALFLDGASVGSDPGTAIGALTLDNISIGALVRDSVSNFVTGQLPFSAVFDSDTNRSAIEAAVADWYGITI